VGEDVWFAHSVHVSQEEIRVYARTGCGVAHCPSSNMRLASGIAPLWEYLRAGVKVGLGVDGSASNDSSHMLAETRQAMLLARLRVGIPSSSLPSNSDKPLITAREVLELATRGGASVLGRPDLGSLEVGKCADLISFKLDKLDFAGALHDPVAALVFCAPQKVENNIVAGKFIVQDGQLTTLDLPSHITMHNQAASRLLSD
jgi:cytosine/adenosine deaminase-related metal-dependent hydrolase